MITTKNCNWSTSLFSFQYQIKHINLNHSFLSSRMLPGSWPYRYVRSSSMVVTPVCNEVSSCVSCQDLNEDPPCRKDEIINIWERLLSKCIFSISMPIKYYLHISNRFINSRGGKDSNWFCWHETWMETTSICSKNDLTSTNWHWLMLNVLGPWSKTTLPFELDKVRNLSGCLICFFTAYKIYP